MGCSLHWEEGEEKVSNLAELGLGFLLRSGSRILRVVLPESPMGLGFRALGRIGYGARERARGHNKGGLGRCAWQRVAPEWVGPRRPVGERC